MKQKKQEGRPPKPEAEKRRHEHSSNYNDPEELILQTNAVLAKKPVSVFIREMSLRSEVLQVVSLSNREAARRVRGIQELVTNLYISVQEQQASSKTKQIDSDCLIQTDSDCSNGEMPATQSALWSEINKELNALNQLFLDYADNHN